MSPGADDHRASDLQTGRIASWQIPVDDFFSCSVFEQTPILKPRRAGAEAAHLAAICG